MSSDNATTTYYFRHSLGTRYLHGLLITTFLGLAGTGMTLRFSNTWWAADFARLIGGFRAILFLHKTCAVLLTAGFLIHVGSVLYRALARHQAGMLWGPNSLVPQPKDIMDMLGHFQWFFWLGSRPSFDRYTYWEKFDYWAVFWGMVIIGSSGYVMWFAPFFARFVPGYMLNVALLIHGEEALLAVWFIFIVHFFNSHLRPAKFPMDPVIFTGRVSEAELREERPGEYQFLVQHGQLQELKTEAPPLWLRNLGRLVAVVAVSIGFFLLVLTLIAFFHE